MYEVVPRSSTGRGSKLIGIRWVETDKSVPGKPKVRSRLVCQEFARGHTPDDMFAPTPPLVATRWLLSELASQGRQRPGDQRLMVLDFKRASLYADCEHELYVELPEEDEEKVRQRGRAPPEGALRNPGCTSPLAKAGAKDYARSWVRGVEDDRMCVL